jgi:tetrahydromethanopterin S-methyltransferase subunit G
MQSTAASIFGALIGAGCSTWYFGTDVGVAVGMAFGLVIGATLAKVFP